MQPDSFSVHPPITSETSAESVAAIKAVAAAARVELDRIHHHRQLDGPRTPAPSARKQARLRQRAGRRANRG